MKIGRSITVFYSVLFLLSCGTDSNYVTIKSGEYVIGEAGNKINPKRTIIIDEFEISKTEITNSQFEKFIVETNYITTAEQLKNAKTFRVGLPEFEWIEDTTAYWRFPFGKSLGSIESKMNHPVTCISYIDIQVYCSWANERLPTLVEWEIASKGGLHQKYFFGDSVLHINTYANIWKNKTHAETPILDTYLFTAPVASFKPNQFGIYDMYGNVFEFCDDQYELLKNNKELVCARGGSWWCSTNSCNYFNSIDIGRINKYASFSNHGFRTVKNR